jgi:SNF family Na+-dependent transporter
MIMMLLIGFPVLILELAVGQYMATTPLKLYGKVAPMFAGLQMLTLLLFRDVHDAVILMRLIASCIAL